MLHYRYVLQDCHEILKQMFAQTDHYHNNLYILLNIWADLFSLLCEDIGWQYVYVIEQDGEYKVILVYSNMNTVEYHRYSIHAVVYACTQNTQNNWHIVLCIN